MDIAAKNYHDEDAVRGHLEEICWPNSAVFPSYEQAETVSTLGRKGFR